jgi:imidazole glycerol-phosphate synthase subunit HisH
MISIIDYGMGNLRSVQKAFERVGFEAEITSDPARVAAAQKVVLPGVGAFEGCISELRRRGLVDAVLNAIGSGKPFLGICVGMQLLFDVGYENGTHQGLGVIPGDVVRFDLPKGYAVPHMGWNQLVIRRRPPILEGIDDGAYVYFVHSYYCVPKEKDVVATETDYGGNFCSMIWRDNVFATQFHPEKSQAIGLRILKNFAELPL